ncbi:hypothetical protein H5410_010437, partial [Solanum commersonii]
FQKGGQALTVITLTNRDPNSTGGSRFTNAVGINYTKQTLVNSTNFIWAIFQQTVDADKKQYTALNAFAQITFSLIPETLKQSSLESYFMRQLMFGNSSTPGGLIEGIADYVRLKAGYVVSNWAKNDQGTLWDESYSVTARFLDYCNGLRNRFVAELNKKMRSGYSNNFLVELLGKTPEQLFVDYKAKYNSA